MVLATLPQLLMLLIVVAIAVGVVVVVEVTIVLGGNSLSLLEVVWELFQHSDSLDISLLFSHHFQRLCICHPYCKGLDKSQQQPGILGTHSSS